MRQNWQLWEGVLPKETCEKYLEACSYLNLQDATIFKSKNHKPDHAVRTTKVAFVNNKEIQNTIRWYLEEANRNAFNVEVNYLPNTQYGEYSEGSFYDWHYDVNWKGERAYDRKLSICVQLCDSSEYEGGDFEFKEVEQPIGFRTQGSILVFPSYLTHRVTKVTKGTRKSLVNWMEGPRWR
jgi:PKHD-type hydroxylase